MNTEIIQSVPGALQLLAASLGTEIRNNRLEIPERFGTGYCSGYAFNAHIRMVIMDYELREDHLLDYPGFNASGNMLLFKFQNFEMASRSRPAAKRIGELPKVLITTSRMNSDTLVVHSNKATINIEVDAAYLDRQLTGSDKSAALQSLLQNEQALLFDQAAPDYLQQIIDEMLFEPVREDFKLFHLRVKAEELVCKLLMKLDERREQAVSGLNARDIEVLYRVRAQMLDHLETPPVIQELSISAGMSPTKLKRLFRQVFGDSIFSYYQDLRMKEAARRLKDERLSVSAVGYSMGFSNLSHFTRVFEAHLGMKPKKYSTS